MVVCEGGVDRSWMPLPTCPQQSCDNASLVLSHLITKSLQLTDHWWDKLINRLLSDQLMDKQMNKMTFRDMMHAINNSSLTYFSDIKKKLLKHQMLIALKFVNVGMFW